MVNEELKAGTYKKNDVSKINIMRKLLHILIAISLFHNFAFGQWILQYTGTTIYDIKFINQTTGWACGVNSVILKTTNAGVNWIPQQSNLTAGRNLIGLSMIDSNVGFIAGWFEAVIKTTNGGTNWIVLSDGPIGQGNSWNSSCFINTQTGWICGFLGVVKRTTDGGTTWDSLNAGGTLRDIQFLNSQTGWVAGDGGRIRKTTDGGNTWQFQFQGTNADYWYNSLSFINTNTGWLSGYETFVFKTTNSGIKWDTLTPSLGICIHFINNLTGWSGGNMGRMYKTTNGGFNWYQQTLPAFNFMTSINFYNDTIGWAANGNRIIHTENGGGTVGIVNYQNEIPKQSSLFQNYPNPFNNQTSIKFDIMINKLYKFEIYDVLGRKVESLFNENKDAGKYTLNYNAQDLPSGVYFYRLSSVDFQQTMKFSLIK